MKNSIYIKKSFFGDEKDWSVYRTENGFQSYEVYTGSKEKCETILKAFEKVGYKTNKSKEYENI